ncbi:ankyrin repeat domain-containing protein [Streptomyces sp. NPDC045431]|uniref:ankyrin repeat domain-containing protein n=1 Tax=Streptomyces sp. NPDC045431 TaxID=3155613 RepID=UPI0033E0D1B6
MIALAADEAASWRGIRRYAVPRWMIERATEHRLAGDWAAACATANVRVAFDLAEAAAAYGADVAAAVEEDLRHLAPDLLRWHLPRLLGGRTTLEAGRTVLLSRHGDPHRPDVPHLQVTTPAMAYGPQRLTLRLRPAPDAGAAVMDWTTARHLWDARYAGELRERCGGGPDRAPFLHPDGTPRTTAELSATDPGADDPAARTEWLVLHYTAGDLEDAFAAAGIELDLTPPPTKHYWSAIDPLGALAALPLNLSRLKPEARRLADALGTDRLQIVHGWRSMVDLEIVSGGGLRVSVTERTSGPGGGIPKLPEALWRLPADIALLRAGGVEPRHLHPLVAASLLPGLPPAEGPVGPPGPTAPEPVRVRCRGEWHQVVSRDRELSMPHSEEERQRERALRAFGGAVAGCFAAQQVWTSGEGRLPRALRAQRQELFLRAQHGDTPGVLELLDAGVDPKVRDGGRRTLLHMLPHLDHETLLPRLLSAGVDLEARDLLDRTPLLTAVAERGSRALVEALVDAGARLDAVDSMELSVEQLLMQYQRTDLAFLKERLEEEHPGIGADWWEDFEGEEIEDW